MITPLKPSSPGATDYALLLGLGAIWGASFIFIRIAVASVPAFDMTLSRLALTVTVMLGLLAWMRERLPPWGPVWGYITLSALFGNAVPFVLIAWGEERIDGGLAAILMSPMPLLTAVLAHVLTRDEKLNRPKLAGIALGIVGVVVMMGLDKLTRLGDDAIRQLAVLAAGCFYAINVVSNRGLTGGSPVANVTAVMVVTLAMLVPFAPLADWHIRPSMASLGAIVALAVFSTCVGTLLLVEMIRRQGAAFAAQVNFLVPLFGVVWGAVLLAERPSLQEMLGLALILGGVAIARRGSVGPRAQTSQPR